MTALHDILRSDRSWRLEEFAEAANDLLPSVLPVEADSPTPIKGRLVRHYTTLKLLDEPEREGREARYGVRHLMQFLLLRRLQAEGYTPAAIGTTLRDADDLELRTMIEGGIELGPKPSANPALAYLETLKNSERTPGQPARATQSAPPAGTLSRFVVDTLPPSPSERTAPSRFAPPPSHWTRIPVAPGLEIHLASDYPLPRTQSERDTVLKAVADGLDRALIEALQRRKP